MLLARQAATGIIKLFSDYKIKLVHLADHSSIVTLDEQGKTLMHEMRRIHQEEITVKKTMGLGAGVFIKKPYTMEQLAMAIKEELAR